MNKIVFYGYEINLILKQWFIYDQSIKVTDGHDVEEVINVDEVPVTRVMLIKEKKAATKSEIQSML